MTILGVGGGSLGPVTPLLATWQALKRLHPEAKLVWIGTPNGPEGPLLTSLKIPFSPLPVAKLPRYPSVRWLTFPFDFLTAKHQAKKLLDRYQPNVIMNAGGFTALPVISEAAKRGIPCVTHQLDVEPGMTNKKVARLCKRVTTSFEYERPPFGDHVSDEPIATPTRFHLKHLPSKAEALRAFHFEKTKPVILIIGGGTGSLFLNELVHRNLKSWLPFAQVLHSVGTGKATYLAEDNKQKGYHGVVLFEKDMATAYAAADAVIVRAGIGTLSEVAALKKSAIVIPLEGTHQEANAQAFENQGAAIVMHQKQKDIDTHLQKTLELLVHDQNLRREMGERAHTFFPTDDGTAFAKVILSVL